MSQEDHFRRIDDLKKPSTLNYWLLAKIIVDAGNRLFIALPLFNYNTDPIIKTGIFIHMNYSLQV